MEAELKAALEELKAAAAKAKNRAVKWSTAVDKKVSSPQGAFSVVLEDLGLQGIHNSHLTGAAWNKLGPELLEQQEATGCAKFVAYLEALLLLKPAVVSSVVSSVDWDAAFFSPITESGDNVHLLSKLDDYAGVWDGGIKWQAPFAAVVQSSGWGKSRSICDLWKHGVFVIYCSMSKATSTGFPGRSKAAACFDPPMSEALVCAYFVASLEVLACSSLSPESWIRSQIGDRDEIGDKIVEKHSQVLPQLLAMASVKLDAAVNGAVRSLREKRGLDLRAEGVQIVFAFDEGSGVRDFPVFQRGLRHLARSSRSFVVLADTNASISNFAPHRDEDPTGRSRPRGQCLFDPIHLIGRADAFDKSVKSFRDNFELGRLFLKGRPLWGAHWSNSKHIYDELRVQDLVAFGSYKLVGGKSPGFEPTKLDAAALFMATIGPEVLSRSQLAQGLVAGHMATCVATLDERRELALVHTSEPVLAAAAASLMHEKKFFVRALRFLADFLTQGLVLGGVRGELVIRLILLRCMHKCCGRDKYFIAPVTLREFLQTLFGPGWKVDGSSNDHLDALVFFNHFVPLYDEDVELSDERLQNFIRHGAAILYAPGEFAADIGIPWVMLDGKGDVVKTGLLDVQVKNRSSFNAYEFTESLLKLRRRHKERFRPPVEEMEGAEPPPKRCRERAGPPVVIVNLGDGDHEEMKQEGSVTGVFGFSSRLYGFLPEEVVDAMKRVLAAKKGSGMSPGEIELMKQMAVLSYLPASRHDLQVGGRGDQTRSSGASSGRSGRRRLS